MPEVAETDPKLELHFGGSSQLQLHALRFRHQRVYSTMSAGRRRSEIQGHASASRMGEIVQSEIRRVAADEGINVNLDDLEAGPALMALALLIVQARQKFLKDGELGSPAQLSGRRPSPASSLYDSLEQELDWHAQCFGYDASGRRLIRECFRKRKDANGWHVSLKHKFLFPREIAVFVEGENVSDDRETLQNIARQLHKLLEASRPARRSFCKRGAPGARVQVIVTFDKELTCEEEEGFLGKLEALFHPNDPEDQ